MLPPAMLLLVLLLAADRFSAVGQTILEAAPQITVMSVSPEQERVPLFSFHKNAPKAFHGYRILRSVEVSGDVKSALLGKLYTSMAEEAGLMRCFNPRHAIRASSGNHSVDLLICFECHQIKSWIDGKESGAMVSASAEEQFNKLLASAPAGKADSQK